MKTATLTAPRGAAVQAAVATLRAAVRNLAHRVRVRMRYEIIRTMAAPNPMKKGGAL